MQVSYKLTERDVLEAQGKHGGTWGRSLVGIVLFAVGSLSLTLNPRPYPAAVGLMAGGLFLMFLLRLQVWFSFKQNNKLQEQLGAAILDHGIDLSSPTASTHYQWERFTRYLETKNLFLVYQSPKVFNVFPKRAFGSGEVDEFRGMLDRKLGSASIAYRKKVSPKTWALLAGVIIVAILLVRAILSIR
jgi:hypothetical protein